MHDHTETYYMFFLCAYSILQKTFSVSVTLSSLDFGMAAPFHCVTKTGEVGWVISDRGKLVVHAAPAHEMCGSFGVFLFLWRILLITQEAQLESDCAVLTSRLVNVVQAVRCTTRQQHRVCLRSHMESPLPVHPTFHCACPVTHSSVGLFLVLLRPSLCNAPQRQPKKVM